MFNRSRVIWSVALLVVALAVAGTGGALAASGEDATVVASEEGGPPGEDELILDFTPSETTVQPGENVTYEVVARGTGLGISAYSDVVVAVEDPEVAEIVDVDANVRGGLDNSEFLDDGALSLGAVLLGNPFPAESNITLATVTVSAAEERNESTTLTYREDARQSFAGPGDVGYEIAETRDATLSVREEIPAQFQLPTLDPGVATVQNGETVDISTVVANEGGSEGTQTVELAVGDGSETQRVNLAPGENTTVVFEDIGAGLAPGEYTYSVSTANATREATLTVEALEPADFALQVSDIGELTPRPGDAVDISATVTNEGDREATQTVELTIRATTETQRVTLAGNESETVVFEDVTAGLRPGDYTVTVSTANESTSATLSMSGPPPLANNEPDDLDDDGLYEDVRGDGSVDILDVQELFTSLNTQTLAENAPAFNFQDRDSEVNILDVQALFDQIPDP
jgi:hypothetical protein